MTKILMMFWLMISNPSEYQARLDSMGANGVNHTPVFYTPPPVVVVRPSRR